MINNTCGFLRNQDNSLGHQKIFHLRSVYVSLNSMFLIFSYLLGLLSKHIRMNNSVKFFQNLINWYRTTSFLRKDLNDKNSNTQICFKTYNVLVESIFFGKQHLNRPGFGELSSSVRFQLHR